MKKKEGERPVKQVPRALLILLAVTFSMEVAWHALQPKPVARAEGLGTAPPTATLRMGSLGEPIAMAQLLTLRLQAFDNQPGISIPFRELDYERVISWLKAILELDPIGQYPLLMASQVYGQVPEPAKQRAMCDFVFNEFRRDPDRRWRWLAQCAIMAKHRLNDMPLALSYAEAITKYARHASNWARQMRIFILEDLGEREAAIVLLGGLLASGEVTEPKEIHFLTERLETLKRESRDGKSSPPTKN
jgi:hypothetical protein